MNTAEKCAAPDGVLLIDKPAGMTSHDVVSRVRRLFGTRQVGHTGTLDPMATGVLILLLGRAAKASEYVSHDEKSYEAVLRLGLRTDTEDTTGVILSTAPAVSLPDGAALDAVLPRFRGKICQIPPMYSALKVGGRKLCDIARAGGTVERQPRPVEIRALTAEPASLPSDFRLHVTCSGGTYIRTLLEEIAAAMGQKGTMSALRRTAAGLYTETDAHTLEEILAAKEQGSAALEALMLPVESVFTPLPLLVVEPWVEQHLYNGCPTSRYPAADGRYRVRNAAGQFLGLANITGGVLRVEKLFVERN